MPVSVVPTTTTTDSGFENRARNPIRAEKEGSSGLSTHTSTSSLPKRGPKVIANIFDEKPVSTNKNTINATTASMINKSNSLSRA